MSNGIDIHDNHYLNAEIHIPNATKFKVDVALDGLPGIGLPGFGGLLKLNIFRPRSSALICAIDKVAPLSDYRELHFGERKNGDFILFSRRNTFSSINNQLPRHTIEFEDKNAILTSVSIKLNVIIIIFTCNYFQALT